MSPPPLPTAKPPPRDGTTALFFFGPILGRARHAEVQPVKDARTSRGARS